MKVLRDALAGGTSHPRSQHGVPLQPHDGIGNGGRVADRHGDSRLAVDDELGLAADVRDDAGAAAAHRLEDGAGQPLGDRRREGHDVARGGEGNVGFRFRGGPGGGDAATTDTHRTVYLPIVRDLVPEVLTIFDFPDPALIIGERATTTIPAQSLFLLNNPFVIRQAEGMAEKLLASSDDDAGKLARAYQLTYSRPPTEKELKNAQQFLADYGKRQSRRSTWAALCQALFASAEFSHR